MFKLFLSSGYPWTWLQNPPIPIPTPFMIPTPDPAQVVVGDPLWNIESMGGALSALQTVFMLAEQYYLMTILFTTGAILFSIVALSKVVSGRMDNV